MDETKDVYSLGLQLLNENRTVDKKGFNIRLLSSYLKKKEHLFIHKIKTQFYWDKQEFSYHLALLAF